MPAPDPVRSAIAALTSAAEPRTWSLIVTIFGDLARGPGAEIPGPVLSALIARVGVTPAAVRVALHRLRKDGWIDARRAGRVSHHFLTESGRAQSQAATARIYARQASVPAAWHVAVAGPLETPARLALDGTLAAAGYVALAPGAWLASGPVPDRLPEGLFALEGQVRHLPDWLRAALMPAPLATGYARFDATLGAVGRVLGPRCDRLAPLDRAALRILVVHGWRRLVLRHPDLPDAVFPDDWPGRRARARVHEMLDCLGAVPLVELVAETEA